MMLFLRTETFDRFVDVGENFVAEIAIKNITESFNITNKIIKMD